METDRNLLYGVLALQLELIDSRQFAETCSAWAAHKDRPLADLLVERGWLTAADHEHIASLLERKLRKHGGDARKTLGAVAPAGLRAALGDVHDAEIRHSLDGLPGEPADFVVGEPAEGAPPSASLNVTMAQPPQARSRYLLARVHAEGLRLNLGGWRQQLIPLRKIRAITGLTLDPTGVVRVLDANQWNQNRRRLEELGRAPIDRAE